MKVLIASWGSTGDVLPPIAVGWALRRRGHQVAFAGNPYFERQVAEAGLELLPVGRVADHERMMADSALFDRLQKTRENVLADHYYPHLRAYHETATRAFVRGSSILLGGEVGSATAAEQMGMPWALVACSPGSNTRIRSRFDPLHPERQLPDWTRWLARSGAGLALLYRLKMLRHGQLRWPEAARATLLDDPPISDFRRGLGLPGPLLFRPQVSLCMWPDWFAAPQPDWPEGTEIAGFPLYPRPLAPGMAAPCERRPVLVTSGTLATSQLEFYDGAAQACARLDLPALLVTPHRENVPATLPPGVRHLAYAPFHELIPRASLVIHHGGIGTASYAFAAGVPQVMIPMRGDQFDNANRVQRLGVGTMLWAAETTPESLARVMRGLLDSPEVARRCREWQRRTDVDGGLRRAADLVEEHGRRGIDKGAVP